MDNFWIMDKLLDHPGFRLVAVYDDGNMSLISPLEHKEHIIRMGYRCISHLWGNATRWGDHPVKNISWGVDVREEKRAKLLQIFNHYGGYWWMDVFCTDQESSNKPLSIMGDVYRNCKECICMLDIEIPRFINQSYDSWSWNMSRVMFNHVLELPECKWSKRVWTLQEWVLPREVSYTTETHDGDLVLVDPGSAYNIAVWGGGLVRRKGGLIGNISDLIGQMLGAYNFRRVIRTAVMTRRYNTDSDVLLSILITKRECKDPRDYYYGIAGMFNIPLTDGLTFLEVEKEFMGYTTNRSRVNRLTKITNSQRNVYEHWQFKGTNAIWLNLFVFFVGYQHFSLLAGTAIFLSFVYYLYGKYVLLLFVSTMICRLIAAIIRDPPITIA